MENMMKEYYNRIKKSGYILMTVLDAVAVLSVYISLSSVWNAGFGKAIDLVLIAAVFTAMAVVCRKTWDVSTMIFPNVIYAAVLFLIIFKLGTALSGLVLTMILVLAVSFVREIKNIRNGYIDDDYRVGFGKIMIIILISLTYLYKGYEYLYILCFAVGFIFILGRIISGILYEMSGFLGVNLHLSNAPVKAIVINSLKVNAGIIAAYTLISIFVLLFHYKGAFSSLGVGMAIIFRFIVNLIKYAKFGGGSEEKIAFGDGEIGSEANYQVMVEVPEWVLNVLGIFTCLVILAVIIGWIVSLVLENKKPKVRWQRLFQTPENENTGDKIETLRRKKGKSLFARTNSERVRRKFRKDIKRALDTGVPSYLTAHELAAKAAFENPSLSETDRDSFDRLTRLYDKARYTEDEISDDEFREINR